MPAPKIAQECRAEIRTKKRIFLYGFGYGSLDKKNGSLDTKNGSFDTKNGSFDMAIYFWIWPYLLDMVVGGFLGHVEISQQRS
jgi:hypothetical protein